MASIGDRLLALGSIPGPEGRAPAAWTTADGRAWRTVPVEPRSPYAFRTELASVGIGDRIVVLGQAFGGAHSNPRMTVWSGSAESLVEHPQAVELFGGPHAIAVSAAAALGGTGLLIGQWDGPSGRYGAAVWTSPDDVVWDRRADDPALSSAPGEQTGAVNVTTGPPGFVAVGNTLRGTELGALVWTSPEGRSWQRYALPGERAVAQRIGCDANGCLTFGQTVGAGPAVLCWPSFGAPATTGPRGSAVEASQVLVRNERALATIRVDGGARLVSVTRDCTDWRDLELPVRAAQARLGVLPDGVVLATTDDAVASRLWLRRL